MEMFLIPLFFYTVLLVLRIFEHSFQIEQIFKAKQKSSFKATEHKVLVWKLRVFLPDLSDW